MVSAKLMLNKIKAIFQSYWKVAIFILICVCLMISLFKIQQLQKNIDTKDNEIHNMTQEHTQDINALQNELNINKQNAEDIKEKLQEAQNATRKPDVVYIESSSKPNEIIHVIEEKLVKNDPTLPPEALEKTDKTVVTEQKDNTKVPIGIYKINTFRPWEFGVGMGVHEDDYYIPFSVQRNYSKGHSIEAELHFDPKDTDINGGEIKYNIHF